MRTSIPLLATGYLLAVPFTAYPPGFLRLWRRREPAVYAAAQLGGLLVVAGWAARRNVAGTAVNVLWVGGLAVAYAVEGRKRAVD